MPRPFRLVPWTEDFIAAATDHLLAETNGDFADTLVLTPLRRAARHLVMALADHPDLNKPCLLPEIKAVDDWMAELGHRAAPGPLTEIGQLDQVGLLYDIVRDLPRRPGRAAFPDDLGRFFPWGQRLAALLDELYRQGLPPRNLDYLSGEVLPTAAALLENLRDIGQAYHQALLSRGLATPGLLQSLAASDPAGVLEAHAGRRVLALGFLVPTGGEETLLKALWRAGQCEILWHADPALAEPGRQPHFSCLDLARWRTRWGARVVPAAPAGDAADRAGPRRATLIEAGAAKGPRCVFYEAYDLHSQLDALSDELARPDTGAVILPDTGLLMPVLHVLPRKDVNISMGYPLARSALARLLETVMELAASRLPDGRWPWRRIIELLRHPYLKMLGTPDGQSLAELFHAMEERIRQGGAALDPRDPALRAPEEAPLPGDLSRLADRVFSVCLLGPAEAETLAELARALSDLSDLLLDPEHAGDIWERFLIDAECLMRLNQRLIPALATCLPAHERLPRATLFSVLRRLLDEERVAFEAEPLSGLQIMGLLETRLLRFDRLVIIDAVEGRLPPAAGDDPLLPDSLRGLLELPDARQRDRVAAYHFHRLVMGAGEVVMAYQTGTRGSGFFEDKAVRSRFVEQLLWEEEKRRREIIKPGMEPLRSLSPVLRALPRGDGLVPVTPAARERLDRRMAEEALSASFFDAFLSCPVRFFYRYLTPLRAVAEVAEDGDRAGFGELAHEVLRDYFTPYLGREIAPEALSFPALRDLFFERLAAAPFFRQMPPDGRLFLEKSGAELLSRFFGNIPRTTPILLETPLRTSLEVDGRTVLLYGKVDRVDRRQDGIHLLDYKTGGLTRPLVRLWSDDQFWERLDAWRPGPGPGASEAAGNRDGRGGGGRSGGSGKAGGDAKAGWNDGDGKVGGDNWAGGDGGDDGGLFEEAARRMGSVQLPLYGFLYARSRGEVPAGAAFVELRGSGLEVPLFDKRAAPEDIAFALTERAPIFVAYLTRLLRSLQTFVPRPGPSCAWCEAARACGAARIAT